MKARVNETTGEVLSIGEGKYPEDGPGVIEYTGDIPEFTNIKHLFYNGSEVVNDPANIHAVAHDAVKTARNDIRVRLRDDRDNRGRDGMPQLADSLNDMLKLMSLENE